MAATVPSSPELTPLTEFDDYVIQRELGHGQMGQVYLAEDTVLARAVAIKLIAGRADVGSRQQFLIEARAAARIQHPNVVAIYRVGELDGRPYIVSELVRGQALADLALPLPARRALELAVELARGLAAAHRRGVVHCDVKPDNVMVTDDGVAKLVDFGLARLIHEGDDDGGGIATGTPAYMAPEVWDGQPPSRASDVYSLGAVVFELCAGGAPFAAVPTPELPDAVRGQAAPSLVGLVPDLDPRLAAVVARCLERDPALRFPSAEEVRAALEPLLVPRAASSPVGENPYRGLRTFEADHRALFFGRSLEVSTVLERLRVEPIVIVAGDSGIGKSSLIRAGVLPAILDGALDAKRPWQAITMVPGRWPIRALAQALGEPGLAAQLAREPGAMPRELRRHAGGSDLVLFVDQLEELVTVADADEREAFEAGLARLVEGAPGIRLVASARADFVSRLAALPVLGRDLARLLYFIAPLPPERLRDVVTGPAAATDVRFEDEALIGELIDATARAGSGGLPLLSFALAELWEARDRTQGLITHRALDAMGGVAGALARHADGVLASLSASARTPARRALVRLVSSLGTRVRRTEAELDLGDGTRAALEALVKGRLLVVHDGESGATYELAHEVLVAGWGTLRGWLDHDAEARAVRERVAAAAAEWERHRRRTDLTWRGRQLAQARALDRAELNAREAAFVGASVAAHRRRRWAQWAATILGTAAVLAVVLGQRHLARTRLTDAVDGELGAAGERLIVARAADHERQAAEARAFVAFDAGEAATGEAAWQQTIGARARAQAAYRDAAARVEAALAKDPARTDARDLLGDVLLERALLADEHGNHDQVDELRPRIAAYDRDGSRQTRWRAPATLVVAGDPGTTTTLLAADGAARPLGPGRVTSQLAPGPYLLSFAASERATVRLAILLERDQRLTVTPRLPRAAMIPPGYVYVPAGAFTFGSRADEDTRLSFFQTEPAHRRTTAGYLIARTELTIADWLAYVEAQPPARQPELIPNLATGFSGALVLARDPDGWRISTQPLGQTYQAGWERPLVYSGRSQRAEARWTRLPMTGISAIEVEGYAAWLATSGRLPGARLCTEVEWERAARGADGRGYPHGDRLAPDDANVDITYGRALMGLDEVGSHPASDSLYGLADMSGNAFEWTRGDHRAGYVARGGSYYHDRKTAHLTNRYLLPAGDLHDATLGGRLCADLPEAAFD